MDTVDRHTRSQIMASVRQKDTGPELLLRRALHKGGLRYRLHDRSLPGSPDLVFPRFRAVMFVHGCYWHSHGCYKSTVPKSRRVFWRDKFTANRKRDKRDARLVMERGLRVMVVWECALLGKNALSPHEIVERIRLWLKGSDSQEEISGIPRRLSY